MKKILHRYTRTKCIVTKNNGNIQSPATPLILTVNSSMPKLLTNEKEKRMVLILFEADKLSFVLTDKWAAFI